MVQAFTFRRVSRQKAVGSTSSYALEELNDNGHYEGRIPTTHRRLTLRLHTDSAYGAEPVVTNAPLPASFDRGNMSQVQSSRFQVDSENKLKWKPFLSGNLGLTLLSVFPIVAWYSYQLVLLSNACDRGAPGVWSALFILCIGRFLFFLLNQETRREAYQLHAGTYARGAHRFALRCYKIVFLLLGLPLIGAPPVCTQIKSQPQASTVQLTALQSWADMLGELAGFTPSMRRPAWSEEDWPSWGRPSTPWILWLSPPTEQSPAIIQFDEEGDLADPVLWEAAKGYGIVRPVLPVLPVDKVALPANWTLLHDLMLLRMRCEQLHPGTYLKVMDDDMQPMLSVNLSDAGGCTATAKLRGFQVANARRAEFGRTLDHVREGFGKLIDINKGYHQQRFRNGKQRLAEYIQRYDSARRLEFFRPAWVSANLHAEGQDNTYCSRRHFVAGTVDPMVPSELDPADWPLFAASCSVVYDTAPVQLEMINSARDPPFRGVSDHARYYHSESIQTEAGQNILPNEFKPLDDSIARRMDEIFHAHMNTLDLADESYAIQLVRSHILAGSYNASNNKFAVVNAENLYLSFVAARVASSSALALDRSLSVARSQHDHLRAHQERKVSMLVPFQENNAKNIMYSIVWALLTVCSLIAHMNYDKSPSGIPWDISSVAARIALLCHSTLPKIHSVPTWPAAIFGLRPLRIGYWKDGEKEERHWCADTQLYQPAAPREQRYSQGFRWNSGSVPWFLGLTVFPFLFIYSCAVLFWTYRHARRHRGIEIENADEVRLSHLVPPLELHPSLIHPQPYSDLLWLAYLPLSLGFAILWYWTSVLRFYTLRQPWVGLNKDGPSTSNLTLDYQNCWFPLWKAIRNKHYVIAYMQAGLVIITLAPLLVNNYFHFDVVPQHLAPATARTWYDWSCEGGIQINDTILDNMQSAVSKSLLGMTHASTLPKWSSFHGALLPVALPGQDLGEEKNGSWSLKTNMVRAEFTCETAVREVLWKPSSAPGADSSRHFDGLSISFPGGFRDVQGKTQSVIDPCIGASSTSTSQTNGVVLCSTWAYHPLHDRESTKVLPRWIIAAYQGRMAPTENELMVAASAPTSTALICTPTIWNGAGTAQLLSWSPDQHIAEAFVYSFQAENEHLVDNALAREFSELLNTTVSTDRKVPGTMRFGDVIATPHFRGNVLSYMAYRWALLREGGFDDESYKPVASTVFSTVFAASLNEANLFAVPRSNSVPITPTIRAARLRIRTSVAVLCLILLCATIASLFVLGVSLCGHDAYLFPFAPEPLENSFHFLYRSTLLDVFKQIKHPERMSLRQFYHEVDRLDLVYAFGLPVDGHDSDFRVDVADKIIPEAHLQGDTDVERQPLRFTDDSGASTEDEDEGNDAATLPCPCA